MEQLTPPRQETRLLDALLLEKYEPIAIVGIGLRLPGDNHSADDFREFLRGGGEAIVDIPEDRWDNRDFYSEQGGKGRIRTNRGGYLGDIRCFDPKFFNISPKEADYVDPQQRLVLETAWEALEHAQIDLDALQNGDGGVFVGVSSIDYSLEIDGLTSEEYEGQIGTGTAHSAVSGRLSYFLGWRGPSVSIDTACSSSLVALHLAIQALRRKECSIALCGGVNAIHHPRNLIVFSQANMLARDGRCKTFDDSADGYGRSEGCATVVLKRVSDALRDGDRIIAVLRGSSVNQDGESGGLTVPNGTAQELVMRRAIANAALRPTDIGLVEAHGTGTSLGDPIEVAAINSVFRQSHTTDRPIRISSAKANIGHTEAAAGIVGVVKAALQVESGEIFPHIGMQTPSRHIPWKDYIVDVPVRGSAWVDPVRRCVVNSFGFAGTIASVVLEQPQQPAAVKRNTSVAALPAVLTLSAKSRKALAGQIERLHDWLTRRPDVDLSAVAHTSNRRAHFAYRVAVPIPATASGVLEWLEKQQQLVAEERNPVAEPKLALLFTGQGVQHVGMGRELYALVPEVREVIDACDALFAAKLGISIKEIMFGEHEAAATLIGQTQFTQAALFTLEYAIARYWIGLGLKPQCLIGHSIGEIAAACVAGLFTLADAVQLVAARGQLMQSINTPGGMLAVSLSEADLAVHMAHHTALDYAAINGPLQCVVSGSPAALAVLQQELTTTGVSVTRLDVSHAFHSRQMHAIYDRFRTELTGIQFHEPDITLISNVTGQVARFEEIADIEYWVRHIGEPVRFAEGIRTLAGRGAHVCLEVGPSGVLCGLGKQSAADQIWLQTLHPSKPVAQTFGQALKDCYVAGLSIDWGAYHHDRRHAWIDLPFYAFERRSHWLPVKPRRLNRSVRVEPGFALLGQAHPTAGAELEFRRTLSASEPAYLADHQLMGRVVFPGAGYVETLIGAQMALFGEYGIIRELAIHEPLYLDNMPLEYATRCTPEADGLYSVRIVSRLSSKDGQIERLHVTARLQAPDGTTDQGADLSALAGEPPAVSHYADMLYPNFEAIGLHYGEAFQRLRCVRAHGDAWAVAELNGRAEADEFLSPALLDAAMQSLAALVTTGKTYVPVTFEQVRFFKQPRGAVRSVLLMRERHPDGLRADLLMLDGNRPVCLVRGLGLKLVAASAFVGRQLYHEPVWKKRALVGQPIAGTARVLTIGPAPESRQALAQAGARLGVALENCASWRDAWAILRRDVDIEDLVYHWRPMAAPWSEHYAELLDLVQTLDRGELGSRKLRLWLVTELAQMVEETDGEASLALDPQAASLWGFGHSLLNEYPRWRTTRIDLPNTRHEPLAWQSLLQEILADGNEYALAFRAGHRYVQRIVARDPAQPVRDSDFELRVTEYGLFEHILPVPIDVPAPADDEVQVAVRAAGLNFKDVLNALGLLKQHAEEHGLPYDPLPLGFEASGEVVAVGRNSGFTVGESVMLSKLGCFKSRLNLPAAAVVRKPANLSHAQAAAVPTAYITAYYALHELAGIQPGDKVLIHAAAGGVGQAAVQLARLAGAEVYATASVHKWPLLQAQGVHMVMNSRSLDFRRELLEATGGEGVDIVLNSLNKDYIPAGLDCLRSGGRFVELGKIGIWDQTRVDTYRPGVRYHNFDLSELPAADLLHINRRILEHVAALLADGRVAPLPTTSYDLDELQEAFGVLSRGANTGKLVIRMGEPSVPAQPLVVDPLQSYLITGGFGALGQALADKLVALGARHIALCGRRVPSAEAFSELRRDWPAAVRIYPLACDVGDVTSVGTLFGALAEQAPPLAGVFHTAGVLADAPIRNQELASFQTVFAPKIDGTDHLLAALGDQPAFFVGFSSVASVLGSTAQSNYAAANAYIDHRLRCEAARGRYCLSVNWGPWADIGMTAGLSEALIRGIEDKGILLLKPKEGLRALVRRLPQAGAQTMICEFDWPRYASSLPFDNPLYALLSQGTTRKSIGIDIDALAQAAPSEQRAVLLEFLRASIANVLRLDSAEDVEPHARLADLGLDSLVAVELKNTLESILRVALPTSLAFDYPSIPALLDHILAQLWPAADATRTAEDQVATLSDQDIDRELKALMSS